MVEDQTVWKRCGNFRSGRIYLGLSGYIVSTDGALRHENCRMSDEFTKAGYVYNTHNLFGCSISFPRHRLVLDTFFPCPDHKKYIADHINGDPKDNRLSNLRWVTPRGNCVNRKTAKNCWWIPAKNKWRVDFKKGKQHVFCQTCDSEEDAQKIATFVRRRLIREETIVPPDNVYVTNDEDGIVGFCGSEYIDGLNEQNDGSVSKTKRETREPPTTCEICGRDEARMIDYLGALFCEICEKRHKCKTCGVVRLDQFMPCQMPCL